MSPKQTARQRPPAVGKYANIIDRYLHHEDKQQRWKLFTKNSQPRTRMKSNIETNPNYNKDMTQQKKECSADVTSRPETSGTHRRHLHTRGRKITRSRLLLTSQYYKTELLPCVSLQRVVYKAPQNCNPIVTSRCQHNTSQLINQTSQFSSENTLETLEYIRQADHVTSVERKKQSISSKFSRMKKELKKLKNEIVALRRLDELEIKRAEKINKDLKTLKQSELRLNLRSMEIEKKQQLLIQPI
nr:uncharacterized protein LOC100178618 isoform X2 [Ciona intestinalis]XP_002130126.2 uncharacterized protein LOC100178618 isoform X1 [Ciona intestinalis]|eukprot:XP_002130107.2 uncharacterized protein LOC100178618 isoform X2 [Ciona intestinalis]